MIAGPTTGHSVVWVASVAPKGTWPVHVHLEVFKYNCYAKAMNWHGPNPVADDTYLGPTCSRSGGNSSSCNGQTFTTDVEGYIGGCKLFGELDNPYYPDF